MVDCSRPGVAITMLAPDWARVSASRLAWIPPTRSNACRGDTVSGTPASRRWATANICAASSRVGEITTAPT